MNTTVGKYQAASHWVVKRFGRAIGNYRVMIKLAPVFAAMVVVVTIGTFVIFAVHGSWWLLLALTIVESALLACGIYVLLMAVGIVQRDNEEKTGRLELANTDLKRYSDRMREDMVRAKDAQQNLLPRTQNMPLIGRVEWATWFAPETEVGGDYYDADTLPDGRAAFLLCDVSGHGMAAALTTTLVKGAFLAWMEDNRSIDSFVRLANYNLCRFTPTGSFAVLVVAMYDRGTRTLSYINAGHSPQPVLVPADTSKPPAFLDGPGTMLLGVMNDIEIEISHVKLSAGDSVFFITDGMPEAFNAGGEMFGFDRMLLSLKNHREHGLQEMVNVLAAEVEAHGSDVEAADDRTVLAIRVQ